MREKRNEPGLLLRHPALSGAIGVIATIVLALLVVIFLLRTGGAKAVSDNAALIGALVALGGVFTTQMVSIALDDRRTRESRNIEERRTQESRELEAQRAHEAALQRYFEHVGTLLIEQPLHRATPSDNLSTVARAQTLAVLEGLDPNRKRVLLQFLYESDLIHSVKPVVSLVGANLKGADLSGANLEGADLWRANLEGIVLMETNLASAKLRDANLRSAKWMDSASMDGPFWFSKKPLHIGTLSNVDLFGATLADANLSGAYLNGANLSVADLTRADLSGANLQEALLAGAYLPDANLSKANLSYANLCFADLTRADLHDANLIEAILSLPGLHFMPPPDEEVPNWFKSPPDELPNWFVEVDRRMDTERGGAMLYDANLSGADLSGAELRAAILYGANLSGTDLRGARLPIYYPLRGTNLSNANLHGTNLSGADLREAEGLTQRQLEQATGDQTTELPDGLQRPKSWDVSVDEHS